jgi:hypothetical protein
MSYVFAQLARTTSGDPDGSIATRFRDVQLRTYVFAAAHEIGSALGEGGRSGIAGRIAEFDGQTLGKRLGDIDVLASQAALWFERLDRGEFHAKLSEALAERLRAGLLGHRPAL